MSYIDEKRKELIEALLEEKPFADLSEGERILALEELYTEENYQNIQQLDVHLHQNKDDEQLPVPDPQILVNLKETFHQKNKSKSPNFLQMEWRIPTYQIAATVALIMVLFVFTRNNPQTETVVQWQEKLVYDTVRITSPPDTIMIDRFITRISKEPTIRQKTEYTDAIDNSGLELDKTSASQDNLHHGYSLEEKDYLLTLNVEMD